MRKQGLGVFIGLIGWLLAGVFFLALFLEGTADQIEAFIEQHDGLFLSVGVVILVTSIGLATTQITIEAAESREKVANDLADRREALANDAADRREKFSQRMQALLEISKFRQAWIDRVRDDFAELQRVLFRSANGNNTDVSNLDLNKFIVPLQRIRLSLNRSEANTARFEKIIEEIREYGDKFTPMEMTCKISEINWIGRKILKDEWERLKRDLEEAQKLEEALK